MLLPQREALASNEMLKEPDGRARGYGGSQAEGIASATMPSMPTGMLLPAIGDEGNPGQSLRSSATSDFTLVD